MEFECSWCGNKYDAQIPNIVGNGKGRITVGGKIVGPKCPRCGQRGEAKGGVFRATPLGLRREATDSRQ